ncbi:MAG: phosphotransferase enzyme family protein [Nanobdellota archaeon]
MVLNDYTLHDVVSNYSLGRVERFDVLSSDHSTESYKVFVRSSPLFPRSKFFLLKKYSSHDASQIRLANNFLLELAKQGGVPVAAPLMTKHNDTVVMTEDSLYSLFHLSHGVPENDHRVVGLSPEKVVNAAKTLASFHKRLSDLPSQDVFESQCFKYDAIANVFSLREELKHRSPKNEIDEFLINKIPQLKKHFDLYLRDLKYVRRRSETQLIHGRFTPKSLVFDEHEVAALLDAEGMRFDYIEYDLVSAIPFFVRNYTGKDHFDFKRLKKFLEAYHTVYSKTDLEPREVLVFLRHSRLRLVATAIKEYGYGKCSAEVFGPVMWGLSDLAGIERQEDEIIKAFHEAGVSSKDHL